MESCVRLAALLAWVLALVSAQLDSRIFFDNTEETRDSSCQLHGRPGECKAFRQCPEIRRQLGNRTAVFDAISSCVGRGEQLVCCPLPEAPPATMRVAEFSPPATFENHPQCGESEFSPDRIVGGLPVQSLRDFPWMALLKWRPEKDSGGRDLEQFRCGGAILNERWVLTAAHCITPTGPTYIHVRDLNVRTTTDDLFSAPPIDVTIERVFSHPDFKSVRSGGRGQDGLSNDMALLKLSSDLQFSDVLKPICLPRVRRSTREHERIPRTYIAGWGFTRFDGPTSPNMLWASVNISDTRTCIQNYRRSGTHVDDTEHICAIGNDLKQEGCVSGSPDDFRCQGGVDACRGDSGGPLMEQRDEFNRNRWYAIGVISFATGCGSPEFPGVYSRVDNFLDWIAEIVSAN